MRSLVDAVEPGDGHVLQDDHDEQRQRGRVVVKHGHKVVPRALHKQQADGEGQHAASHCRVEEGEESVTTSSCVIISKTRPLFHGLSLLRVKEKRRGTCEKLLAEFEGVDERRDDALDGAEHAAQAQVDQHEEEHDGPEGRGREVSHGLGEGDEGQAGALDGLSVRRRRRRRRMLFSPDLK